MTKVVSVLIADDSALMRREIRRILESDPGIKVLGTARNGKDAIEMIKELNPDVVTLDINMPVMDGMTALAHIMMECPRPVIMLSSLTQEGALTTYEALELGAVDYIAKPGGTVSVNIEQLAHEMIAKIKAVVGANLSVIAATRRRRRALRVVERKQSPPMMQGSNSRIIVIGESTGGPNTIFDILPLLPPTLGVPIILVQHMPSTFTPGFASRLNQYCQIPVKQAESGDILQANHAYLAPGGSQLVLARSGNPKDGIMLRTSLQPNTLHKPSVDVTMKSALELYGTGTIGVLLTGMGDDGADAMVAIRHAGGRTIAESEETCVVFGMPKEAIRRGGAEFVLPSYEIATQLINLIAGGNAKGGKSGLRKTNNG